MARNPGIRRRVSSIKQLDEVLMKRLRDASIAAKPEILAYLQQQVYDKFYMQWTPEDYERTYEMAECLEVNIRVRSGGLISIERNLNYDKMTWNPDANQHGAFDDSRQEVLSIIEEGNAGPIFGKGFWTKPRPFWDEIIQEADKTGAIMEMVMDRM